MTTDFSKVTCDSFHVGGYTDHITAWRACYDTAHLVGGSDKEMTLIRSGHIQSVLYPTTAGAPPSPTTIAEMERTGFKVVHVYGLTETYGPITVCQPQPQWTDLPVGQRAAMQARQGVSMIQAEGLRVGDRRCDRDQRRLAHA